MFQTPPAEVVTSPGWPFTPKNPRIDPEVFARISVSNPIVSWLPGKVCRPVAAGPRTRVLLAPLPSLVPFDTIV